MRWHSARFAFLTGSLLVLAASAAGQSSSGGGTADSAAPQQVIRATTRLVQVSVIVQDKNGAPITGLTKEHFCVFDDRAPQDIAFFSASVPTHTAPHRLPANFFTNRTELKGQDPGATIVILFDALNTSFEDQSYAREQMLRFLRTVKPQDRVALFALTTELVPLHDFTEDAATLASSVSRFSPRLLAAFDASHPADFHVSAMAGDGAFQIFENHVNNANGEIADSRVADRFRITYSALVAIADYVASIPGRKSLVWVSGGIPIQLGADRIGTPDRDNFRFDSPYAPGMQASGDMGSLARALNRVNMAIYAIDVTGIDINDSPTAFFMRQDQRESFRLLADRTGGKAFYGTNDVAGAINSAFDDGRYTYTLGFYPHHGAWDGKFRDLKVSLNVPDSQLRYRRGYFAFPDRAPSDALMKAELQEAARSPLDATALGVNVHGKTLSPASARTLQLQVGVDLKQLLLQDQNHHRTGGMDLLFVQRDAAGNFLAAEKQHFDVNFNAKEYESLVKTGLVLQRRLQIEPGSTQVRVLVRDVGSGVLGSVTFPVKAFFVSLP